MNASTAEDRDVVGPYRLLKAIGAGGSARVDLARIDRAYGFQRHVVLKRPLEHLRGDARAAASLHREARIGGLLRHPHLIAVLDAGVHDNYDYLVLEYIHGASLRTLMQCESAAAVRDVPVNVALAIVTDVARGLHHAHELADESGTPLGLVHRDVSPGNILVAHDGAVKLADFGIAKETRVATLSGSMHGTVTYMAPEQCRGHAFDRRADVFSLGVILYELVTGARLFWADNDVASLHRVLSGTVTRPRKLKPLIAPALEDIVMTALAHDPERRFVTAKVFADALEHHAAATGELLGGRWIARWVEQVLGHRDVPWVAAAPAAPVASEPAPRGDGSLVDLIAAMPADLDPEDPDTQFGPTDPNGTVEPEHLPTDRNAQPYRGEPERPSTQTQHVRSRRGRMFAAIILGGLATGAVATALVMTRTNSDSADALAPRVTTDRPDTASAKPDTARPAPDKAVAQPDTEPRKPDTEPAKPDIEPTAPDTAGAKRDTESTGPDTEAVEIEAPKPDTRRNGPRDRASDKRTSRPADRTSDKRRLTNRTPDKTPDSRTPDKTADKTADKKTPDSRTPDSRTTDIRTPDKQTPDKQTPDKGATTTVAPSPDKPAATSGSAQKPPQRGRAWNPDQLLPDDPAQGSAKGSGK